MNKKDIVALYQGDCLKLMKNIPDESIDLIVTDPPYKLTPKGSCGTMGGFFNSEMGMNGRVFECNDIEIEDYINDFYRVLKDRTHCYIMCNNLNLPHFLNIITNKSNFHFMKCLIWDKGNKICGRYYMSQFEYIIMLRKGGDRKINNCGTSDILSVPNKKQKGDDGKNLHNSEKPVKLMEILIENSSNEKDIILDPFMGIGTSAIACINLNRCFIGFELDEKYYNISYKRVQSFLKK